MQAVLLVVMFVANSVADSVGLIKTVWLTVLLGVIAAIETTGEDEVVERATEALIVLVVAKFGTGDDDE